MIIYHCKLSLRLVIFCLCLLFLLNCSTGPEFVDLSEPPEAVDSSASGTLVYSSFGGWWGTAVSEHFVMKELKLVPLLPVGVGGDVFSLSPQSGFSVYLQ